ncbi:MAG: exo-alpha-sialidase [Planctomycetia bacterium]|nr:exo-alpha-sialidase [Planctomycetia bacterium]
MKIHTLAIVALLLFGLAHGAWLAEPAAPRVIAACDDKHYRHSEGSVIEMPDGRLLMAWSRFDGHKDRCGTLGDNGPATIVLAESADGGKTWSEPRALPVGTATLNIMQAAFVPVRNGLMLAFSVRTREGHTSIKHAIESKDGGKTWTERRELFPAGGPNDRAVRLSTGRILMASHRVSKTRIGKTADNELLVARSDDEGATWKLSDLVEHEKHAMESKADEPHPLKIHEPAIAECRDGSLLLLARSVAGVLYQSRSKDAGVTWSKLEPTKLSSFAAPPYLRRLKDGRLALLWNPITGPSNAKAEEAIKQSNPVPYGPRRQLALATSADDGRTWSAPRIVAEDGKHGFCYPWTHERPDGTLLIFCSRTPFIIYPADLVQLEPIKP